MSERKFGRVTRYNVRGFGFIRAADGARIFLHVSDIRDGCEANPGMLVSYFEGVDRNGKPRARQVKIEGRAHG